MLPWECRTLRTIKNTADCRPNWGVTTTFNHELVLLSPIPILWESLTNDQRERSHVTPAAEQVTIYLLWWLMFIITFSMVWKLYPGSEHIHTGDQSGGYILRKIGKIFIELQSRVEMLIFCRGSIFYWLQPICQWFILAIFFSSFFNFAL
jgi:hypothetical protein